MEFLAVARLDGRALEASLAGLSRRLTDLSPAMELAGQHMLGSAHANFDAQGRPDSWQPLAPETVRKKGQASILYETGNLYSSVSYSAGPDALSVGSHVPYARAQQEGGGHVPARPFLLFQEADIGALKQIVASYLTGAAGEV